MLIPGLLTIIRTGSLDFIVQLTCQFIQFTHGASQCIGFISEYAVSRLLDTLAKFGNAVARLSFLLGRLLGQSLLEQSVRVIQLVFHASLFRFAKGVVQFLSEQRFGCLGFPHRIAHPFEQLLQVFLLLVELFGQLLAARRISQVFASLVFIVGQLLAQFALSFIEGAGLFAKFPHFLGELVGRLTTEIVSHPFELAFGASARRECSRDVLLIERFGRFSDVFTILLQVSPCLFRRFGVDGLFHPIQQFVGLSQKLLLLIAQPLELTLDLFALLPRFGRFEGQL